MRVAVFLFFAVGVMKSGVVAGFDMEFTLSVNGLPNSYDSYCKVDVNTINSGHQSLGQTEVDHVNKNPSWSKVFKADYSAGENKDVELYVWTKVQGSSDLFLGGCTFNLEHLMEKNGKVVSSSYVTTTCKLSGSNAGNSMDPGDLTVKHRITSASGNKRSSASRNYYISLPSLHSHSNILVPLSLTSYYFL